MSVRPARETDAPVLLQIFNDAISSGVANTETQHKDLAFMEEWMREHDERYAVLVYENGGGNVVGYASLNTYFPKRPAYRAVADISYYVAKDEQGRGIGSELVSAVLRHARLHGFHKCTVRSFTTNEASRRLLCRFGFRCIGVFEEDALVDAEWRSVAAYEKILR